MKRMKKEYRKAEDVLDRLTAMQIATLYDFYNEDLDKSMVYLEMAAEGGNAYAQTILANAYSLGCDVEKSDELALMWYRKAAEQGYPYAQYELGKRMHDEEGGLLWLHLSAKQGFWLAMKELSDRLRLSDPKASERWLKRYYRNKDKHDAWRWHGKKYMREYMREQQPEMIDGEVVILI